MSVKSAMEEARKELFDKWKIKYPNGEFRVVRSRRDNLYIERHFRRPTSGTRVYIQSDINGDRRTKWFPVSECKINKFSDTNKFKVKALSLGFEEKLIDEMIEVKSGVEWRENNR